MKQSTYLVLVLVVFLCGCVPFRAVFLGAPDHNDIHRFRSNTVARADDCFEFVPAHDSGKQIKVNEWGSGLPFFVTLEQLAQEHAVRSMLVIKNDSLLFEYYGEGTNASDVHPSYSIAKSFTSALIGIAIDEGHIKSERDLVADYLPELTGIQYGDQLRIEHLLNQCSGIRYSLKMDASLYYGNDVSKLVSKIQFERPPGTAQHYLNINIQLLGLILQKATGMTASSYLSTKLWKPMQACHDALWTTDHKGQDLSFCCLGATALDYAKFGRLFLHKGMWNGTPLISERWVDRSLRRDTTEGSSFNYNYCWHLGDKEYGDYMADGLYKQHIYVYPDKKVIIVLLCNKENQLKAERVQWRNVFRQIVDQL